MLRAVVQTVEANAQSKNLSQSCSPFTNFKCLLLLQSVVPITTKDTTDLSFQNTLTQISPHEQIVKIQLVSLQTSANKRADVGTVAQIYHFSVATEGRVYAYRCVPFIISYLHVPLFFMLIMLLLHNA